MSFSSLKGTEDGKAKPLRSFEIERFFNKYEFAAPHQLSCSDAQPLPVSQMLKYIEKDSELNNLWNNLTIRYTFTNGDPLLRKEIANDYNSLNGIKVYEDNVLVCCPEEGVFLFMNTFLKQGDEIVIMCPLYQSLYELARSIGCVIKTWHYEDGIAPFFTVDKLKTLVSKKTKLVIVNIPHNPTGWIPNKTEFAEMIKICKDNDAFIFGDEMYRGLVNHRLPNFRDYELPSICEVYDKSVVLSGMSKVYGLPGLRLGWIVVRDEALMKELQKLKDYTTICPPVMSEIFSVAALRNKKEIVKQHTDVIEKNLSILKKCFSKSALFEFYEPHGGSIYFPRLSAKVIGKYGGISKFSQTLIEKCGVILLPAEVFLDFKHGEERGRFGTGRVDLPVVLKVVENFLQQ